MQSIWFCASNPRFFQKRRHFYPSFVPSFSFCSANIDGWCFFYVAILIHWQLLRSSLHPSPVKIRVKVHHPPLPSTTSTNVYNSSYALPTISHHHHQTVPWGPIRMLVLPFSILPFWPCNNCWCFFCWSFRFFDIFCFQISILVGLILADVYRVLETTCFPDYFS